MLNNCLSLHGPHPPNPFPASVPQRIFILAAIEWTIAVKSHLPRGQPWEPSEDSQYWEGAEEGGGSNLQSISAGASLPWEAARNLKPVQSPRSLLIHQASTALSEQGGIRRHRLHRQIQPTNTFSPRPCASKTQAGSRPHCQDWPPTAGIGE